MNSHKVTPYEDYDDYDEDDDYYDDSDDNHDDDHDDSDLADDDGGVDRSSVDIKFHTKSILIESDSHPQNISPNSILCQYNLQNTFWCVITNK